MDDRRSTHPTIFPFTERAYRPDDDLVAAASSNLSELLALRGGEDEQALELAERAVRLTDRMERLSLVQTQEDQEDGEAAAEGPAGAAVQTGEAEDGKGDRTPGDASDAIWTLSPELLALNSRNIMRRLNLGRLLVRADGGRPKEEALWYLFQALNDSRKPGLRGNPIIYSQTLAAVGAAHLSSMLATVRDLCVWVGPFVKLRWS